MAPKPQATPAPETPVVINKFCQNDLKNALDDAIVLYFTDVLHCKEDNLLNNILMLLGALCCASATVAHFYPIPFPDNRSFLAICIISYIIFNGALTLLMSYVQGNRILKTVRNDQGAVYEVRTSLTKYSPEFIVGITTQKEIKGRKVDASTATPDTNERSVSVTEFFDEKGTLIRKNLYQFLESLMKNQHKKK